MRGSLLADRRRSVTDCSVAAVGSDNCRLNAFVCRNINVWNRLPAHVVNSDSVAAVVKVRGLEGAQPPLLRLWRSLAPTPARI